MSHSVWKRDGREVVENPELTQFELSDTSATMQAESSGLCALSVVNRDGDRTDSAGRKIADDHA